MDTASQASAEWRLRDFSKAGYNRGRGLVWQIGWFAFSNLAFQRWWFPPRLRPHVLRMFGATVGTRVFVRHRVRILWPWKLTVGRDVWIGEGAWILNLEPVSIGNDVCVSQEVLLCTGSHDRRSVNFAYDNGPITIHSGVWLGIRSIVLRGVVVPAGAVVPANFVVRRDYGPAEQRRVRGE